ncbi:MAG: hypothetical protein O3A46_07750 [Candidatus Poribacteria bacterium]|nr:hypothetical protein [Candidatus Poribacteria bacterium]
MRKCWRKGLTAWLVACGVFGIVGGSAVAKTAVDEQRLVDPPHLFSIPTAQVLPAFDVNVAAESALSSDAHRIGGTLLVGVGDLAQIEWTTTRTYSDLGQPELKTVDAPSIGLRLALPLSRAGRLLPDVAASVRRNFEWQQDEPTPTQEFIGDLYLVGSWNLFGDHSPDSGWRGIDLHAGGNLTGLRRSDGGGSETLNEWTPFAGIELWMTRGSELMVEWRRLPIARGTALETAWSARGGMRFFFTPYLTLDVGAHYREDFETVADTNLEARFGFTVPVHQIHQKGNAMAD